MTEHVATGLCTIQTLKALLFYSFLTPLTSAVSALKAVITTFKAVGIKSYNSIF